MQPLVPMATGCAVALLTLLAVRFASTDGVVVLWLANAVAAAVWVRAGRGLAFDLCFGGVILVGLVTGEFLSGYWPATALILAAVNALEIVIAVALMRRFAPGQSMSTVRSTIVLLGASALIAPVVGAAAGSVALLALKGVPLLTGFQVWWFSHALGMVLVAPIIFGINRREVLMMLQPMKMLEAFGLFAALITVAYAYYFLRVGPISLIVNMILVIIAARFRMAGIASAVLITAIILFGSILYGPMPQSLAGFDPGMRVMTAQLMLLSVCLPFMLVAALLNERDGLSERARSGQRRAELASESKSRLLANVAHEIKSPVAGVIGIGELWSSGQLGPANATQKEMAEMLVKTARQVETLAHDLLDVPGPSPARSRSNCGPPMSSGCWRTSAEPPPCVPMLRVWRSWSTARGLVSWPWPIPSA